MSTLASELSYEYLRQHAKPETEPESKPEIREGSFSAQAQIFLDSLAARRSPVKPATLSTWTSIVRAHILSSQVLAETLLAETDNQTLREFVDELVDKELGARSIRDVLVVAKMILRSATDARGNRLYKWEFNHDHINAPSIGSTYAPAATKEIIEHAIKFSRQYAVLIALGAASGLRIGELLSIKTREDGVSTCFDREASVIRVRQSVWHGKLQDPKTKAAIREVDLCGEINTFVAEFASKREGFLFASKNRTALSATTVYRYAFKRTKIQGAHSLRRFRATRLEEIGAPEALRKYWLGHAKTDITEKYGRLSANMELRKEWANKAGLGFAFNF